MAPNDTKDNKTVIWSAKLTKVEYEILEKAIEKSQLNKTDFIKYANTILMAKKHKNN